MTELEIKENVAYCGLICSFDSCYKNCKGCKQGKECGDEDCYHKKCCTEKSINGCWECDDFPCNNGYFSDKNKSKGQFISCIKYIKKNGLVKYNKTIKSNMKKGIKYGLGGDYGNKTEDEVMKLLTRDRHTKNNNVSAQGCGKQRHAVLLRRGSMK